MTFRPFALGAAAAVALAGIAPAGAALAQPGDPPPGPEFVRMAGASDKFEITEAQIAQTRSHDPRVRDFAKMMVRDHTKSTMKVKAAARRVMGHNPPPPMLRPDQQQKVADLRAAHGPDFDRTYLDQQVAAHQEALDLMQGYARGGDAPPLRHAAEEIAPVVQHHLEMARDLQSHAR